MGISARVLLGTGRARCIECGLKIQQDEKVVIMSGWRSQSQIHLSCLNEMGKDLRIISGPTD